MSPPFICSGTRKNLSLQQLLPGQVENSTCGATPLDDNNHPLIAYYHMLGFVYGVPTPSPILTVSDKQKTDFRSPSEVHSAEGCPFERSVLPSHHRQLSVTGWFRLLTLHQRFIRSKNTTYGIGLSRVFSPQPPIV